MLGIGREIRMLLIAGPVQRARAGSGGLPARRAAHHLRHGAAQCRGEWGCSACFSVMHCRYGAVWWGQRLLA